MNPTVKQSRTVSKNFQSASVGIELPVPDGRTYSECVALAKWMIRVDILKVAAESDVSKFRDIYEACFSEPIEDYVKVCESQAQ